MQRQLTVLTAVILSLPMLASPAVAQSGTEGSNSGLPQQTLSEEAQALEDVGTEPEEAFDQQGDPIITDEVNVSLGDWDVRTELSESLSLSIADLPLTVALDSDLASAVCPVRESDLEQQEIVSAIRTCAAKSVNDELVEAVRASLQGPNVDTSVPETEVEEGTDAGLDVGMEDGQADAPSPN